MQEYDNTVELFEDLIYTDRMSTMLVCINGERGGSVYGTIVNLYLKSSVSFEGLDQMILRMDEICEVLGGPKITMSPRFLQKGMEENYYGLGYKGSKNILKAARLRKDLGGFRKQAMTAKCLLVVQILYRNNASMQGKLSCSFIKGQSLSFRSALELMRMLDEAGPLLWGGNSAEKDMETKPIRYIESVG